MYKSLTSIQRDIFTALLLLANHKEKTWEWKGEINTCQPGQFITSLDSIKALCAKKVTLRNIRTALDKFIKWGFLTNESTKTGRLITIIKWDIYQGNEIENDKGIDRQVTKNRQTGDRQVTTNKNDKNVKKEKNKENLLPDWLNKELWNQYKDHRKELKSKFTPYAEELAIKKLGRLKMENNDPQDVIEQSIENGWKGLFEVKSKIGGKGETPITDEAQQYIDKANRLAREIAQKKTPNQAGSQT